MSCVFTLTLACVAGLLIGRVASYSLTINPKYQHVTQDPQSIQITCNTDVPLTGCQFKWFGQNSNQSEEGPLLDLCHGHESQANPGHLQNGGLIAYNYLGGGLEKGQCGITLQITGEKCWMVTCRVRVGAGGWTYAWADFVAGPTAYLHNTLSARELVVLPGNPAEFLIKTQEPLRICNFAAPSATLKFGFGGQARRTGHHQYFGSTLTNGECGLKVESVTEADNGPIMSLIATKRLDKFIYRLMSIIVAKKPKKLRLYVKPTAEGFTATCTVDGGRPSGSISWFLGKKNIRQDSVDDTSGQLDDSWTSQWAERSIIQHIHVARNNRDNGKMLRCKVSHMTLTSPMVDEEKISYPVAQASKLPAYPDYLRKSLEQPSIYIGCPAGEPLTGCQFIWWDFFKATGPLLDLSKGAESEANPSHLTSPLTGYSYRGQGLQAGSCGISMQLEGPQSWMVACRVRGVTGGWNYTWTTLYANNKVHLDHSLTPREAVVLPRKEAQIVLKAQKVRLRRCSVRIIGRPVIHFDLGSVSQHSTGRHLYHGNGLTHGECGMKLTGVTESDTGLLGFYIENEHRTESHFALVPLTVAIQPSLPQLKIDYAADEITATCEVHGGRPVPTISWFLSGKLIREDTRQDTPASSQDEWRWPWMAGSAQQILKLDRDPDYNGQVLKCVVKHVTFDHPLEESKAISV